MSRAPSWTPPYHPDWSRISMTKGYRVIWCPDHPRAWGRGWVWLHLVIAEQKVGRLIRRDEVVHHVDEDKLNNDPSNLEVMTRSGHSADHCMAKGRKMVRIRCPACGVVFERERRQTHLAKPGRKSTCCSDSCRGKLSTEPKTTEKLRRIATHVLGEFVDFPST